MPDLGAYGSDSLLSVRAKDEQSPHWSIRSIVCDSTYHCRGAKDTTQGDPSQPSLRIDGKGVWRFRWAVSSGTRTISVSVKQALNISPRPTLVVKANAAIGVNSDVTGTAGSSATWVTIGPVTASPSSDGALWVELRANLDYQSATCYWDNIQTT